MVTDIQSHSQTMLEMSLVLVQSVSDIDHTLFCGHISLHTHTRLTPSRFRQNKSSLICRGFSNSEIGNSRAILSNADKKCVRYVTN